MGLTLNQNYKILVKGQNRQFLSWHIVVGVRAQVRTQTGSVIIRSPWILQAPLVLGPTAPRKQIHREATFHGPEDRLCPFWPFHPQSAVSRLKPDPALSNPTGPDSRVSLRLQASCKFCVLLSLCLRW